MKRNNTVHDEQKTAAGTAGHEPITTDAQSTVGHELTTAAGTAGNEPNCPHSGGQLFAEKQSIQIIQLLHKAQL